MKQTFQPIRTLNRRIFRQQKGRNLVAVLAILMTTLMFTTLFTLAQSMSRNLVEMAFRQTGSDAQVSFRDITEEQAALIAGHPDAAEVGSSIVLGIAENRALAGRQVEIRWADETYASHSFSVPTDGRMPQSEDEIALDTITLDYLGVPHELGRQITLEWQGAGQSTFTLCGFWTGNESSYASMAWVSRTFADQALAGQAEDSSGVSGTYTAIVSLYSDNRIEDTMNNILADTGLSGLEYSVNLAYSPEMGAMARQESLPMYLSMLLVFAAGYLIIYNIFQIGVSADIQFYGRLKTLGASRRQIRRLIYGQANRLCAAGIPLGLILGWLLGLVLVPVLMGTARDNTIVSANPVIFLGSALFAWATVVISCMRPARLAGKVSPIEALRVSDVTVNSKRTFKRRSGSASLASMAWSNLGRNKKRTVTVVCSLTLGLVLLSCFYAKNASFDMEKYLADLTIADFQLSDLTSEDYMGRYNPQGTTLTPELTEQMEYLEGVEATGHLYSKRLDWQMDDQTTENLASFYTEDRLADWETYDSAGASELREALKTRQVSATILGVDGIPLDAVTQDPYILDGSYDAEAFSSGNYLLAVGPSLELGTEYPVLPTAPVGSDIELDGRTYTVMAIVYPLNPVTDGALEIDAPEKPNLQFLLPADTFRSLWPENTLRKLYVNVDDAHIEEAQAFLDEYTIAVDTALPVTSRQTMAEQYESQTRSSAVMGNAVSVVIALVGVLNFVNSMVTAIVSRKREFAMIQSIGMTRKQLCRMLVDEGLYYAGITLMASYLISALAVGIVIRAMVAGGFSTFRFTLFPLIVCTPFLILFAVLIPYLCFRNLEKQSIVERLRME